MRDGSIVYGIKKDTITGAFAAKFYNTVEGNVIVDFLNVHQLIAKMSSYALSFEAGYDFERLYAFDSNPDHWFLDTSSCDSVKKKPVPAHVNETKVNPTWVEVPNTRELLCKKHFYDEERDYFDRCHNTFEVHASSLADIPEETRAEIESLQNEKFKGLNDLWDLDETRLSDEAFARLVGYTLMDVTEYDNHCVVEDMLVPFSSAELFMVGCKNSAKGGLSYDAHVMKSDELRVNECKTTTNVPASLEAMTMLYSASRSGAVTIRPHTMNPKDERNKPGKKEKMFNSLDHCYSKYDLLVNGSHGDRAQQDIARGTMMGISCNGRLLDHVLRVQFGIATGDGKLTDGELECLELIASDFSSFEMRILKDAHLPLTVLRAWRFGNGVCTKNDRANKALRRIIAANTERKLLPDLRVGGSNVNWKAPPIQISGENDTLAYNSTLHRNMVMSAYFEYISEKGIYDPAYAGMLESTPKNGDDGLYLDNDFTNAVLGKLGSFTPVKFELEKKGSFLSEIEDAQFKHEGVSFCKQNFVLETAPDGTKYIALKRGYQNLYKIARGNTSTWSPAAAIMSTRSQMANAYGNSRYQAYLKDLHDALTEKFGETGIRNDETRDPSLIDPQLDLSHFPTDKEIWDQMYGVDEYLIHEVNRSMLRHYKYHCPASGVGKF